MHIEKFLSVKEYNTFGIDVKSVYSFFCYDIGELITFLKSDFELKKPLLILGGGSNVLFTKDYEGTIIFMKNKGVEIVKEDDEFVFLKAEAGEIWDEFVEFCVSKNYGGIENLSLIPGTVGASPIQNIGAYGVEVRDVIYEVEVINRNTLEIEHFKNDDCAFGYRESIFKKELKNQYIVSSVTFKLKKSNHLLNLDYGSIKEELNDIEIPKIKDIRSAVVKIRENKLPLPEQFPNAGSFFKNPVIPVNQYNLLKKQYNDLVSYPASENYIKLAAGQLIDLCNWKGKRINGVGVHDKQALVIVNFEQASGQNILEFSEKVQVSVFEKFGVHIEREVTLID